MGIVNARSHLSLLGVATGRLLHVTLFNSTSGKLVQIEHALTAVGSGQTSLGIKAANRVVIATEKKLPSMSVDEASESFHVEPIPVTQVVRVIAAVMQEFTQSGGVRPLGASLVVAGFDDKGPQLFQPESIGRESDIDGSGLKDKSRAKTLKLA